MRRGNGTLIDSLIAIVVFWIIAAIAGASETQFVVVNKMPQFTVVNKCQPCSLCDTCNCNGCECPALEAKLAKPTFTPKTKATAFKTTKPQVAFVQPAAGQHSHTCQNPKCPFTATGFKYSWGGKNHDHTCPYCLTEQTIVDQPTRVTTVLVDPNAIPKKNQQASPAVARTTQTVYETPVVFRSMQTSSVAGGCASGNCSMATVSRGRR